LSDPDVPNDVDVPAFTAYRKTVQIEPVAEYGA
jgi:hypothetical protein